MTTHDRDEQNLMKCITDLIVTGSGTIDSATMGRLVKQIIAKIDEGDAAIMHHCKTCISYRETKGPLADLCVYANVLEGEDNDIEVRGNEAACENYMGYKVRTKETRT